jgi:ABC-type Fe3+ transport system permease subunit
MRPIKTAMYFLAANQLFGFLFGYLANGQYKRSNFSGELFSTMFYALPIVVLLVAVVFPNSDYFGEEHQNVWVAVTIILARTLIDFVALRIKKIISISVQ